MNLHHIFLFIYFFYINTKKRTSTSVVLVCMCSDENSDSQATAGPADRNTMSVQYTTRRQRRLVYAVLWDNVHRRSVSALWDWHIMKHLIQMTKKKKSQRANDCRFCTRVGTACAEGARVISALYLATAEDEEAMGTIRDTSAILIHAGRLFLPVPCLLLQSLREQMTAAARSCV